MFFFSSSSLPRGFIKSPAYIYIYMYGMCIVCVNVSIVYLLL